MTRAIVIGHSHCNAIAEALAGQSEQAEDISVYRLKEAKRPFEHAISIAEAMEIVGALPFDARVFLVVLGGYHNLLGLLRSGDKFDFLVDPSDTPEAQPKVRVPHRAMASAFDQQFAEAGKIRALCASATCPVLIIGSPPPKRNNDLILQRFMTQKKQVYRGKSVEEFGIERPESRLKLWLLEERLMAEWAQSQGAQFLPAPEEARDAAGFLKEEYYSDDVTHANAGYGALVLDQIAAIIRSRTRQALHG